MASDGEISCTNDPNFAVIYSFLKVFGKLYNLEVPTITKLQEFIEDTQDGELAVLDIIIFNYIINKLGKHVASECFFLFF